jgi:hypothetical protein
MYNGSLKTKVLESLKTEDPDQQKNITRIRGLIKKIENNPDATPIEEYGELGRLIRENQNIEPVKL